MDVDKRKLLLGRAGAIVLTIAIAAVIVWAVRVDQARELQVELKTQQEQRARAAEEVAKPPTPPAPPTTPAKPAYAIAPSNPPKPSEGYEEIIYGIVKREIMSP